ncbi:MAG: hypothetical protein DMG57_17805 [Acidobacteria bacterium]|nr:MAG: hypothetical protein DMG57_17805 [Acidobacteriota bacterium]
MRTGNWLVTLLAIGSTLKAVELPQRYFELLEAGSRQVNARLEADPTVDLDSLEKTPGWKHFGYSILAPAVLYSKRDAANPRYHDSKMLALTLRIGDLLASENEKGKFTPRLDSDWDIYTWLEAYRLLESELGAERRERWKRAILENIAPLAPDAAERIDFPWYNSPYIGTSPNHYAQWAQLLFLGGRVFDKPEWVKLGSQILHRFASTEQTPDGYWGEHSRAGPTTGYDHLTLSAVALYGEYSDDPAVIEALRRSTGFHMYFTYPDGTPVETINDRNRYWSVSAWAQFAFTRSAEGRRYAAFLAGFFDPEKLPMDALGRLAQDALYYHAGSSAPIPQDQERYVHRMSVPAGIRKTGPWVVCLSGIVDTQASTNQFYLDRQANMSVFHSKLGLIISGANSKRQPELATFHEKIAGVTYHLPLSSRLEMTDVRDRLSLAYNSFFNDLYVEPPSEREMKFRFVISGRGRPPEDSAATLQLVLKPGEVLETAAGKNITLGSEPVELTSEAIGGWIRHHGWTLNVDPAARLVWPVYPFNPYANAPETTLEHAVAALSVPLRLKSKPAHYVRPDEQQIVFSLVIK